MKYSRVRFCAACALFLVPATLVFAEPVAGPEQHVHSEHSARVEAASSPLPHQEPHQGLHEQAVPATQALGWLKNGNVRYLNGKTRRDGASATDRSRLKDSQSPHSIVLSCSDSRVPPEIVFDEKLGEIFTVRTAGESLDAAGIASIEYAVEHLGPQLIVVMGHTKCGAVKAALGTLDGSDAGSENLNKLVQDLHPRLKSFEGKAPSGDFEREGWANAKGVAQDLGKRSKIIASKLKDGTLQIVPALYHLDSGKVDWAG